MRQSFFTAKNQAEIKEITQARLLVGLAPIRMGYLECFKCTKQFFSEDLKNQRSCNECRKKDNIDRVVD